MRGKGREGEGARREEKEKEKWFEGRCVYRAAENENPTSFEVNLYD